MTVISAAMQRALQCYSYTHQLFVDSYCQHSFIDCNMLMFLVKENILLLHTVRLI